MTDDTIMAAKDFFNSTMEMPPSYAGNEWLYAVSLAGLGTVTILCIEWTWRLIWQMFEVPKPFKHPLTVSRVMWLGVLFSVLCRIVPDVILRMAWPELSADDRLWWAQLDKYMDTVSAAPMLVSWFFGILGSPMIDYQMVRMPIPIHLWPRWEQVRRPLRIGVLVLGISVALAFLR